MDAPAQTIRDDFEAWWQKLQPYEKQIYTEFNLCADLTSFTGSSQNFVGEPQLPQEFVATGLYQQLIGAMVSLINIQYNSDLADLMVTANETCFKKNRGKIHIYFPETTKEMKTSKQQRGIYDSMDRFVARLLKERDNERDLYIVNDHVDHSITLHFKPLALIEAMHRLTHTKFRGNETILGQLYFARHLSERLRDYLPAPQMN